MPKHICKLEGKYFIWSTIVDGPLGSPMNLEEFRNFYTEKYGLNEMLDYKLSKVEECGTSARDETLTETLWFNRAGRNETKITLSQLKEWLSHDFAEEYRPLGKKDSFDENEDLDWSMEQFLQE